MRVENWEKKLSDYIEECRHKKFSWESNNCGQFVLEWEKILTGKTKFPEFYKKYTSLKQLKEKLQECGFKSWISIFNQRLSRINTKLAQRGDLVTAKANNSFCMGICLGRNCAFLGKYNLEFVSIDKIKYAWRWF
tara:strand:- start:408 stop:812 length:405 start_codon:yes stop_codon:yes gene_type:complete